MAYREERVRGRRRTVNDDAPMGSGKGGDRRPIAAPHANSCPRCTDDMENTRDMVKGPRGVWMHRRCASGYDDV